jgi:hypothetical protein
MRLTDRWTIAHAVITAAAVVVAALSRNRDEGYGEEAD